MPRGKKVAGRDFQPGCAPGPGRPRLTAELQGIPMLTRTELNRYLNEALQRTRLETLEVLAREDIPMVKLWMASIVEKGFQSGDPSRLEMFATRLFGAPKLSVDVSGEVEVNHNIHELIDIAFKMTTNARPLDTKPHTLPSSSAD